MALDTHKHSDAFRHVRYNYKTDSYDTPDGTSVAAEVIDAVSCLADVLHVADIRENQRRPK